MQNLRIKDGESYEGGFLNGNYHGKGKYTWFDGETYEGDFINDVRTGKGKFTWPNGKTYIGDFINDEQTGKGIITWSVGSSNSGEFINGQLKSNSSSSLSDSLVNNQQPSERKNKYNIYRV